METEIKFLLPEGMQDAVDAHPLLQGAESRSSRQEVTTYYDTSAQSFRLAGASLRLREADGRCVQTLKLPRDGNAFSRHEWEWQLAGDQVDLSLLRDTPLRDLAAEKVEPVFTSGVTRTVRVLRPSSGGLIEVTTDVGSLWAKGQTVALSELELELKGAAPAALYELALALQSTLPLVLGPESKAARGWRLVTGAPPEAVKADAPTIPTGVTGTEAINRLVSSLIASLVDNQPAAAAADAKGVHRMRIAVRRLRTALTLFRPHLAKGDEARFTETLRRLGRILGEARDWDVFCSETLVDAAGSVPAPFMLALRGAAEAERKSAHSRLSDEFAQPHLTHLVIDLSAWALDVARTGSGDVLSRPIEETAPDLLEQLERKVRTRGKRIRRRSGEELHGLRKALKRFRYALEFMAPLMKADQVKGQLHHCKGLQEDLGMFNDSVVAETLAQRLADETPELGPAAAALTSWAEERRTAAVGHLQTAWREFKKAPSPEALG
ncbi:CHAD domain-containing protein [Roseomonas sp. 18066]|uniref:CYTH and CHAD domain-containing protein n=1 Tax=Roseomonas sp. 18066 TaxID=2681412 RepID=UPI00135B8464|nr:CHAD domain-containing protein [Roseomonas sp. 18066]